MSKFKKDGDKDSPAINTASLPDIIFMLLFFFMVVTVLRESELKVQVVVPTATQLTKLEEKTLVNQMYLGRPTKKFQSVYGTQPRLQLGDRFSEIRDIPLFLEQHKIKVPEVQRPKITTSLRVDGSVTMGIVSDVKTELRKANQLKLNYSARPEEGRK